MYRGLNCNTEQVHSGELVRGKGVNEWDHEKLEVRVLHLDAIFHHIQSLLRAQVRNSERTVEVDRNDVPHWLQGDPERLRHAVLNCTVNGIK